MAGAGPPHTAEHPEITVKRTDQPQPEPTPARGEQIGADDEQTVHRPPAPTVREHNMAMFGRPGERVGRA